MTDHDYVIVGGGTAGCVLAARLSENPAARVLLLEAGRARSDDAVSLPAAWPGLLGTDAEWGSVTTPQAEAGALAYPRGRVLGGSGSINAMAHVRGARAVYDEWEAAGADGWGFDGLLPYFRRSESAGADRDPALRGTSGPVRVAPVPVARRHPAASAFAEALGELGYPSAGDLSGRQQEGVAWPDLAIYDGQRTSPARAYLGPARHRPNLTVLDGCRVTRLVLRDGRCTGADYVRDGQPESAHASAEVIVCAGAIGSPQLLLLSGIGPAGPLRALGIPLAADLPGVGENLQDHPVVMACYASAAPMPGSAYNHGETYSALFSPLAGGWPDLQLFPVLLPIVPPGRAAGPDARFTLHASVVAPDSRGTVRLGSADPEADPLIDPGFLTAPADVERLEAGLNIIRVAAATPAMARIGASETWPGAGARDGDGLRDWIRTTVGSYYHPAGTCQAGPHAEDGGVTDSQLRVYGIDGLRVADASVMPVIPNAPLHATVLALAERAAGLIAGQAPGLIAGQRPA